MAHSKTCYMGGYRGPTKCCEGKCLHRMNCNCSEGKRTDRGYITDQINSLTAEREYWLERLENC